MKRGTIQDYLTTSGMDAQQADALSSILSEMEARLATKEDLATMRRDLAAVEAKLTWRMIVVVGFFATVLGLLEAYIG